MSGPVRTLARASRALSLNRPLDVGWIECALPHAQRGSLLKGLLDEVPHIHQSYLYDARGVELYDKILQQPEYYLPAAEDRLLRSRLREIACDPRLADCDVAAAVVELGSGDGHRTLPLIEQIAELSTSPILYAPADISKESLHANLRQFSVSERLGRSKQDQCVPILGMHEEAIAAAGAHFGAERTLTFLFMGSSLGNLYDHEIIDLFSCVRDQLISPLAGADSSTGRFILGVDLPHGEHKTIDRLQTAYNDPAGWTAAFTLNALSHLNCIAGTDFVQSGWRHVAEYDIPTTSIITHVEALAPQVVTIPSRDGSGRIELRRFSTGDRIFVEQSRKFSEQSIRRLAGAAGMRVERYWASEDYLICELVVATPTPAAAL
mgnify:CR=1 FL=1|mmetsp:Transcript_6578/g.20550  ORF Transcript_6578/g.20550 Transcript_6578/m.20550 type:complete len:378 (+) Transcript_6578:41-1174(+)